MCGSLLILSRAQFGYDLYYFYAKLAAGPLRITYVGFDTGSPKVHLEGVTVKYVAYSGSKLRRYLRLVTAFVRAVRKRPGAIMIKYFPGCSLLRCFGPRRRMIVDVRTRSVHPNRRVRRLADWLMRREVRLFRNITVVSEALAGRLNLPDAKTHIVPLGAERVAMSREKSDQLDLLYVGTLHGRRIEDTIFGFERFLQDGGRGVSLTYTIVGTGHNGELEALRALVRTHGLDRFVRLPGYVHRTQLGGLFERCSVGVSYVPINDTYDCQPATKTFEYFFAGMPVIATATTENKKVVNARNGVLIQDTPDDFCRGLKELSRRRRQYDPEKIQLGCQDSSWEHIVGENLVPYIQRICQS